jgi:hypothetical protein
MSAANAPIWPPFVGCSIALVENFREKAMKASSTAEVATRCLCRRPAVHRRNAVTSATMVWELTDLGICR